MEGEVYTENCVPEGRNSTQKNLDELKAWIEAFFAASPDIKVHMKPGFTLVPPQIEGETSEEWGRTITYILFRYALKV